MTNYEKYLSLTSQLTDILEERKKMYLDVKRRADAKQIEMFGSWKRLDIPRKLSKARIHRLRIELNIILQEIENQCETFGIYKEGEKWYDE